MSPRKPQGPDLGRRIDRLTVYAEGKRKNKYDVRNR